MTALEVARLDVDGSAQALARALGRGGAAMDLERARQHLDELGVALDALRAALHTMSAALADRTRG